VQKALQNFQFQHGDGLQTSDWQFALSYDDVDTIDVDEAKAEVL